jgi:transposase-like protein
MKLSQVHAMSLCPHTLEVSNFMEPAMPMNRIQFQQGVSMPSFFSRYGTEQQCAAALAEARWPAGFRCPRCDSPDHYVVGHGARKLYQCRGCRHQTSLTAGTVMDSTKLPLRVWFLAIYLISQDKTGLSSLALMRHLGTSYRTAWLIHQKLMSTMAERDAEQPLAGNIQLDDAYLGGERPGVGGRGSPNKVPIVAAVSTTSRGHPLKLKISAVATFSRDAIARWAKANLVPGCDVRSDGLGCFAGVIDAGCAHSYIVVANRKPRDLPPFLWVNTVLGNLKTMINGAHKHFKFGKYAGHYLGAFGYRFNARVDLQKLLRSLIGHAATSSPRREQKIRATAEVHD